jgi:hypothetical protein
MMFLSLVSFLVLCEDALLMEVVLMFLLQWTSSVVHILVQDVPVLRPGRGRLSPQYHSMQLKL